MEMDVKIEKKARVYTIRQLVKAINKVLKLIPDDHNDIGNRYSINLLETNRMDLCQEAMSLAGNDWNNNKKLVELNEVIDYARC